MKKPLSLLDIHATFIELSASELNNKHIPFFVKFARAIERQHNIGNKMATKIKVVEPAIKTKSGKVIKDTPAYSHKEIEEKAKVKKDKRGFLLSTGEFADRKKAAKIAKAAGEVKNPGKKLHSHELREGLGIKKAK